MRYIVLIVLGLTLTACASPEAMQQYQQTENARQENILNRAYNWRPEGHTGDLRRGHFSAAEVREVNGYVVSDSLVRQTWSGGGTLPPPQLQQFARGRDWQTRRPRDYYYYHQGRRYSSC